MILDSGLLFKPPCMCIPDINVCKGGRQGQKRSQSVKEEERMTCHTIYKAQWRII